MLKWRKTCTGLKFDLVNFNSPQTKFKNLYPFEGPCSSITSFKLVNNSQFDIIGIWQLVYSAHVKWPGRPLQFIPMTVVTTLLFMKGSMRKSKLGFISVPRVFETPWDVRRGKVDSVKITVYYEIIILICCKT